MRKSFFVFMFLLIYAASFSQNHAADALHVKVSNGVLEGKQGENGVRIFLGIPYAAPPVGELRWREPQPVKNWKGVRKATEFGNRAVQQRVYDDIVFRSKDMSEDCLYLNVWTNAKAATDKLPVLVYFHGGGLIAGDGSEPRYDGEHIAAKDVVVVTLNYRLGVIGFLAHPDLTKESSHHASGNYGVLDQRAALRWVKENIAVFGGDPSQITIAGQSAGSRSVSVQTASPLSRNLFVRAIGESGSSLSAVAPPSLQEAESKGVEFATKVNAISQDVLRKIPANQLVEEAGKSGMRFGIITDGYFLPETPLQIYSTGRQADIPLLAGWNSAEISWQSLLGKEELTQDNYRKVLMQLFGDKASDALKLYPDTTSALLLKSATDLASDRNIAFGTWKWIDVHGKTNGFPVYRYLYTHLLPPLVGDSTKSQPEVLGAPHSAEIPYALGNLKLINTYKWSADDYTVSETMQQYFVNFIRTGNPNGKDLPKWFGLQSSIPQVMLLDTNAHQEGEKNLRRYQFLDQFYNK